MLPYYHLITERDIFSLQSAAMESLPTEVFVSLSDGNLIESFLEGHGRRSSRDSTSLLKKNTKNERYSRQNSEASQESFGHARRCSVSFKNPLEDVRQFSEATAGSTESCGKFEAEPDDSEDSFVTANGSVATFETAKEPLVKSESSGSNEGLKRQSSIQSSSDSLRRRQTSENSCSSSDSEKVKTRLSVSSTQSDVSHLKDSCSRQNSVNSIEYSELLTQGSTVADNLRKDYIQNGQKDPKQPNNVEITTQNSILSKQKPDKSNRADLSQQNIVRSKQTSEKSTNTSDAISISSGWSWQGSFKSRSSGRLTRQGSILSRKSWRAPRFRSKSQGDRPERKDDDSSSTDPRVEMVPDSGGCSSAQESANQAAQEILISSPGSSKARQKKFHRHFKTVPPDEKVLNYYSCALVADILLQGHLYITRNYFAFYSNVFGYVTKLLIPTSSVLKVTKEKTAYIIPNAVGVTTEDDKHVFGSLLSRDSTYKLMVQVWNAALAPTPSNALSKPECIEERLSEPLEEPMQDEESSLSGSESNLESKLISSSVEPPPMGNTQTMAGIEVKSYHDMFSQTTQGSRAPFLTFVRSLPRPTLLLLISTGLLVLLFASATVLLYRIARLHQAPDFSTRSMSEVHAYINSNLEHITKVRESLEKLSFLIEHGGKYHS